MKAQRYLLAVLVILIGALFRLHALGQDARLHPDEALFSTFARAAAVNGTWMLPGPLDKTPLTIYAMAFSMRVLGVTERAPAWYDLDVYRGEFAARVPNTFASILLIPTVYALARQLYRDKRVAFAAGLLVALSPFAVAFSATAFTDGLMLLWMALALLAISRGRWRRSGVYLALGFASKQQGLFYVPLVIALGWALYGLNWRNLERMAIPLLLAIGLLALWDAARGQETSLWVLATVNNNLGRLSRSDELTPRLATWLEYGSAFAGSGPLTAVLSAIAGAAATSRILHESRTQVSLVDIILAAFVVGYGLLHWLMALNLYDRYLLPLLPIGALLAARGVVWLEEQVEGFAARFNSDVEDKPYGKGRLVKSAYGLVCVMVVGALTVAAWNASEGRVQVGGDPDEHTDIDLLAEYLNSGALGAIVYDHWLGWELGYYLGEWTDKRRVYYPTPGALAEDALRQPDAAPRYFAAPADQPVRPWLAVFREAGFRITLVYDTPRFVVYELIPPWADA